MLYCPVCLAGTLRQRYAVKASDTQAALNGNVCFAESRGDRTAGWGRTNEPLWLHTT
jgi:hypothetical protein